MTDAAEPITWSLERAAELGGDPTGRVYALLFARHPEFERLFQLDRTGAVRGSMLANALEAVLDMAGPRRYGLGQIAAESANHEVYGVPREHYAAFFGVIRDVVRETLGGEWSAELDVSWSALLSEIKLQVV